MATYTVTISDAQEKGFKYNTVDPQEWIENLIENKARQGMDEIYLMEIERMTNDPNVTSIPADKEHIVLEALIETAAERQARGIAEVIDSGE